MFIVVLKGRVFFFISFYLDRKQQLSLKMSPISLMCMFLNCGREPTLGTNTMISSA